MNASTFLALDGLKVAVVDDNAYFRRIVRTLLTGLGVRQIPEAASAEEGWQLVRGSAPDILLLDWNLGATGGVALLDRIRNHPDERIATQTVIFLSAHSDMRHVLLARRLGANDFIVKPISARLLYERIRRITTGQILYERRGGRLSPVLPGRHGDPRGLVQSATPRLGSAKPSDNRRPAVGGSVPGAAPEPPVDQILYI